MRVGECRNNMSNLKIKYKGNLIIVNIIAIGILYLAFITNTFSRENNTLKSQFGQKKEIAVVTRPMFYASDSMALPFPTSIDFHAKLFSNVSVGMGYSFSIDDNLIGVSQSYDRDDPFGAKGNITSATLRYHKSNRFDGVFGQYTFEIVNWRNYCRASPINCPDFDTDLHFTTYSHVYSIGYGKYRNLFFKNTPFYTSVMIGRVFGNNVRKSDWAMSVELGYIFSYY